MSENYGRMDQVSSTNILIELLRPLIQEAVNEAIRKIELPAFPDQDLLNIEQAAEFLSVSKDYIYRRTGKGEIPSFRRGKRVYLSKASLTSWLQAGR